MTIASTEEFLQAAIAEDGQPVSAGGPPLRSFTNGNPEASSNGEQARESIPMQMVKIHISDKKGSAKALVEMSRRGRVLCFADDVYIVPEPALDLLTKLCVTFKELERGDLDFAENALREASAANV